MTLIDWLIVVAAMALAVTAYLFWRKPSWRAWLGGIISALATGLLVALGLRSSRPVADDETDSADPTPQKQRADHDKAPAYKGAPDYTDDMPDAGPSSQADERAAEDANHLYDAQQ